MALPISSSRLKRLTHRLRDGRDTAEDHAALGDVLVHYHQVLARAHAEVARVCREFAHEFAPVEPMAPRVKTLTTTVEKLRRQPHLHSLAQVRDLAGLRVVVDGSRADQDVVVARLGALFAAQGVVKRIDRRADPRQGYRAVHLEVRHEGVTVELQVRTALQHQWAEVFERTADKLGRGVRYGDAPTYGVADGTAGRVLDWLNELASVIDRYERWVGVTDYRISAADIRKLILVQINGVVNELRRLP